MKKIMVRAYLAENLGDDLFLKILLEKYYNIMWILYVPKHSSYKENFRKYKNIEIRYYNFFDKILNKLKIINKNIYKGINGIVYIGGSIFIQHSGWKSEYKMRRKEIEYFQRNKKDVFILGSNFGPYSHKEFYHLYEYVFKKCKDICFREKYSYKLFEHLENIRFAPDIVFQLKFDKVAKEKNTIGISLINLENRENLKVYNEIYQSKIIELIEFLVDNKKDITLFSFCKGEGDEDIIKDILNKLDKEVAAKIKIEFYLGDIDDFLYKFSRIENIIGARFHSCILSQVFGQGLYPIIYSDKTYNMLKDIGLDNEYIHIKNIDKLNCENVLDIIDNNKINNNNTYLESEKQFEELDKYINE